MSHKSVLLGVLLLVGIVVAVYAPLVGNRFFQAIEKFCIRFAAKKWQAVISIAVAATLLRLVLWIIPIPAPQIMDEFSYLLTGDTFAHGRIINPPHPMWLYLETFQVMLRPTYMSKFHPAQGVFLAIGQWLGHPWFGVLISMGLMCGAALWAMQGWLPPRWALLGGVLVLLRFAIFGYWVNSYWGGAVAAVGGALVIGALPRIMRFRRARDAALLAIGAGLLANSRPLEGFVYCLPVAVILLVWFFRSHSRIQVVAIRRVAMSACAILALCLSFVGYYNWRGTGNPLLFPYVLYERTSGITQMLAWEKFGAPTHFDNPQFDQANNIGGPNMLKQGTVHDLRSFVRISASRAKNGVAFFLYPELLVPFAFAALLILFRDRRVRFLAFLVAFSFAGHLVAKVFLPHYAAAEMTALFILVVQGMRHLRKWQFAGRPLGVGLTRLVAAMAVVLAPFHMTALSEIPEMKIRERFARQLNHVPGQHLIIVEYAPDHDVTHEWVYNAADIDRSKVVWAREIPGVSLQPLLEYFQGRQVWLIQPDNAQPKLVPFSNQQAAK